MPDEERTPKLTDEQRRQVITWLAEGLRNAEVLERVQGEFGVTITRQAVDWYRATYGKELEAAYAEAMKDCALVGLRNRIRRLQVLEDSAEQAIKALRGGGKGWTYASMELRAILKDIRDELGDLKTRAELTGLDGGAIQVAYIDARERLAAKVNRLATEGEAPEGTSGAD